MNKFFQCLLLLLPLSVFSQEVVWKYKTSGPISGSPIENKGTIYFGSRDSNFYALDAEDGRVQWKFRTNGEIRSTPCLLPQNRICLLSGDGMVYCLDASGKQAWKFRTRGEHLYELFSFADYFQSSPVLDEGLVYFGSGDSSVYAVHASDGTLAWQFKTGGIVHTRPLIYGSQVFIGSFDGWFYALNKKNGSLQWKFKSVGQEYFPKGEFNGSASSFDGKIFVGGRDYNFYVLDSAKGYCRWNMRFQRGWAITTPLISDSILYIGTSDDRQLLALRPGSGNLVWKFDAGYNIFGAPTARDSLIYFGTMMGRLFGLQKKTGKLLFNFTTDGYRENSSRYFKEDGSYRDDIFTNIIRKNEDFLDLYIAVGGILSQPLFFRNSIVFTSMDGTIYRVGLEK